MSGDNRYCLWYAYACPQLEFKVEGTERDTWEEIVELYVERELNLALNPVGDSTTYFVKRGGEEVTAEQRAELYAAFHERFRLAHQAVASGNNVAIDVNSPLWHNKS